MPNLPSDSFWLSNEGALKLGALVILPRSRTREKRNDQKTMPPECRLFWYVEAKDLAEEPVEPDPNSQARGWGAVSRKGFPCLGLQQKFLQPWFLNECGAVLVYLVNP